jgi:diadenosine tetraphosphatase ApaH/serine/threonine PP2A family protein phosphatase
MIGVLYDIHGNLPALEAVLADAPPVERWLLGGDYTLFGAWPLDTLARLRALPGAVWLRGNGERWTAAPGEAPEAVRGAITACRSALGEAEVAALAGLPTEHELPARGGIGQVLACHGSPVSDVRSFYPEPAADESELLGVFLAGRLIFGHTHLPFQRPAVGGAVELVNPGSVGMPFDGDPRAAYAVIHDDGVVEHRRAAYDHLASAQAVRRRWGPAAWTETVARRLELSRIDV